MLDEEKQYCDGCADRVNGPTYRVCEACMKKLLKLREQELETGRGSAEIQK